MDGNLEPLPPLLMGMEQQMMASPHYRRAVRKFEQAKADPVGARMKRLRKINRLMAQEDRLKRKSLGE